MKKWEYKVMVLGGNMRAEKEDLDEAGARGWELVSVAIAPDKFPESGFETFAYLKRQVEP